jgi:hypothetical protein
MFNLECDIPSFIDLDTKLIRRRPVTIDKTRRGWSEELDPGPNSEATGSQAYTRRGCVVCALSIKIQCFISINSFENSFSV